jgi:hypothetical protein
MREQHELSKAFPPIPEDKVQEMRDSIEDIGVQVPIVIFEDKVIDGWHRYSIANELGMPCPEVELDDWIDPITFVRALNGNRRHLTKGQEAISYATIRLWRPVGKPSNTAPGAELKTTKELAEEAKVSARTMEQAKAVLTKGGEAVIDAVRKGTISVKRGAQIAKLPKEQQGKAITEPPEPRPSMLDGNIPSDQELEANEKSIQADLQAVANFLDADEKMAEVWAENKKLRYLNVQLEVRNAALMREKNECIKLCKKQQVQLDKFYKAQK